MPEHPIIQQLGKQKLLPLFYHSDPTTCLEVVQALYAAGVRNIEFTNRGQEALSNFKELVSERNRSMKDLYLAVGTIRSVAQATQFMEAGADYLISPVFDPAIAAFTAKQKIGWIPGCMTPTEIHTADTAQCQWIKLFPGNVLGPAFVSSILELFPSAKFIVTGGVEPSLEGLRKWLDAGATAVGVGSKLITAELLKNKDYETLKMHTTRLLHSLNN